MQECRRGAAPDLLARHGPEIGADYARRRREDHAAKHDQWEPVLLRPDEQDYAFGRYFLFNFSTGELEPAPDIAEEERATARSGRSRSSTSIEAAPAPRA